MPSQKDLLASVGQMRRGKAGRVAQVKLPAVAEAAAQGRRLASGIAARHPVGRSVIGC